MNTTTDPQDRPRLLWIHQNFVSARQPGNSRPIHIIAALLEQGWAVDVITTQTGYLHNEPAQQKTCVIHSESGLTIHRLPQGGGLDRRSLSYLTFFLKALRYSMRLGRVDLVYASSPPLPQILLSMIISVWKRAPMVFEVRDLWPAGLVALGMLKSRPMIAGLQWLEAFAYRFADYCVAVTPMFAPYLEHLGVPADEVSFVPTGGDPRFLEIDPAESAAWRQAQGLQDKFVILYAGSFNEQYGIELALSAARQLSSRAPEICWVFAGDGRQRPQIEDAAKELECVQYLGSLSKDELMPTIAGADLGLDALGTSPMLYLAMPGKLFDYMAAGIPVISTNDGLPGAMVDAAGAGFALKEPAVEQLVDAVVEMADLPPETRQAMGRSGQDWILQKMNSLDLADEIAKVAARVWEKNKNRRRLWRFLRAAVLAWGAVFRQRSPKILRQMAQRDPGEAARESLQDWLGQQEGVRKRHAMSVPAMAALLSGRADGVENEE
ncbi:MAG: glycosyltransferase family 4 protein [Candidatus Nealsonbacteria bacterium]|nr:glycosyltransferase family 4 protein [Candidatus Nealsonbacteria bacterium]